MKMLRGRGRWPNLGAKVRGLLGQQLVLGSKGSFLSSTVDVRRAIFVIVRKSLYPLASLRRC